MNSHPSRPAQYQDFHMNCFNVVSAEEMIKEEGVPPGQRTSTFSYAWRCTDAEYDEMRHEQARQYRLYKKKRKKK